MRLWLGCLLLALGCGPRPVTLEFVAPPLIVDSVDAGYRGEPSLQVGIVRDGAFEALEAGSELPIVYGFQGGRWIHVAYRVTGLRNRGHVDLVLDGIGTAAYDVKLIRRGGVMEIYDLPIPVGREPRRSDAEIDALAGQEVHLLARFTVGETSLEMEHDLVLSLASH